MKRTAFVYLREARFLSVLAAPLMVAQVSQMGMSVIDVVMAGRYGAVDLAGVGLGASVYWPTMLLLTGTLLALTPTVAQLYGAGRTEETGAVARQAMMLGLLLGSIVFWVLQNMEPVYRWLEVDPQAIPISVEFLRAQSFGVFGMLGYLVLRNLTEGLGLTVPTMVIVLCAFVLKIPLTYFLCLALENSKDWGELVADGLRPSPCGYNFLAQLSQLK